MGFGYKKESNYDIFMGKLSISLSKEDEAKFRKIAEENCRSLSGQISYWIKKELTS